MAQNIGLRRAILFVGVANLSYFFVEFWVARQINSISLFADSIDFLEDAAVNFLILIALGWPAKIRAFVGMFLSGVLLIPAVALVWAVWQKFATPTPPEPWLLSGTGLGALVVNLVCAFVIAQYRHHEGSLVKAAFLSARNDALANIAIIGAGLVTLLWLSGWPDLIVGIGILIMNLDAAQAIWKAARDEHTLAEP
ncbi:cation transporter [Thermosynechococcaceae cyanobacterium BACA0444]|uniref:Cation transporter n=1 Tax=Pseudocalidococcus azoricus BACA0444 TaxID=2918990 RepID=A0AAE4JWI7_9CYAN|nr:cation transporter [Pseudocalidococcus azoricus]MDS3861420.1 cation transporter [Pseudocalidococcus azoricus BACA0444]